MLGGLTVGGLTDVGIGSRKARTLLAALLLARPADQLAVLASRLRRILGADAVRRGGHGYWCGINVNGTACWLRGSRWPPSTSGRPLV